MQRLRNSGVAFEEHVAAELRAFALSDTPGTTSISPSETLADALRGATVYGRWADVPARLLVALNWESRDVHERKAMYEGPADGRGWREYGGDWLALLPNGQAIIIGQDKDHGVLSVGVLGRFISVSNDVYDYNMSLDPPQGAVSSVLCFPAESRITRRDKVHLEKYEARCGMHLLSFPDFQPRTRGEDVEMHAEDTGSEEGAVEQLVPLSIHRPPPRAVAVAAPTAPTVETEAAAAAVEPAVKPAAVEVTADTDPKVIKKLKKKALKTVYAAAKPKGGSDRLYQKDASTRVINNAKKISLIKAPPGCGKTAIVVLVLGRLMLNLYNLRKKKDRLIFITVPFIDHADQFVKRLGGVLSEQFGVNWKSEVVVQVCDKNVLEIPELKKRLNNGARVFVSTDVSAHLLYELAEHACAQGYPLLAIKDEAHYNSDHSRASTKLLTLAAQSSNGYAIACTATPDANVMSLPNLVPALDMPLADAIADGSCAPYEVVLPLINEMLGDGEHMPVEARDLARSDQLGAAALFCVGGMVRDGKRRCIAYANSINEAERLKEALEKACAFYNVGCEAHTITEGTSGRKALYDEDSAFQVGTTEIRRPHVSNHRECGEDVRPKLYFLVAVMILDQCIDIPATDAILIATPPTSNGDVKSAHRAIQRLGRGTRPKPGGQGCVAYIFTDEDNPWLQQFFRVLREFDPGCVGRVRVASSNPVTCYTKALIALEKTSFETLCAKYDISGKSLDGYEARLTRHIAEVARLIPLMDKNAVDPVTGKPARRPPWIKGGKAEDEDAAQQFYVWNNLIGRRSHQDRVQRMLPADFDLDRFLEECKIEKPKYTVQDKVSEITTRIIRKYDYDRGGKTGSVIKMPSKSKDELANDPMNLGYFWVKEVVSLNKHHDLIQTELNNRGRSEIIAVDFINSHRVKENRGYTTDEQIDALVCAIRRFDAGETDPETGKPMRVAALLPKTMNMKVFWNNVRDNKKARYHAEIQERLGDEINLLDVLESQRRGSKRKAEAEPDEE